MSTGFTANPGSGGSKFGADNEVGGTELWPIVKVAVGAAGSGQELLAGQQTSANSLGVTLASDMTSAKGSQPSAGQFHGVQQPKDSGRTYVTLYLDAITGITTEALATMNINVGGTVTTGTSWTVPTGKTFRIQSIQGTVKASSTTAVYGRIRLRSAATVAASSGIVANLDIGLTPGTAAAGAGNGLGYAIPDGLEIAAGQQVGITHIESSTSSTVSAIVTGFYY